MHSLEKTKLPRIIAHRGGSCLNTENSLPAFRHAVGLGVEAIEVDVHLTKDGVPVVNHDAGLEQTSHGSGSIGDLCIHELSEVQLRGNAGAVPRLSQVLDELDGTEIQVLVEIKHSRDRSPYPGIEEAIVDALRRAGRIEGSTVIGFHEASLLRVREIEPGIRICRSFSRMFQPDPRSDSAVMADLGEKGFSAIMVFSYELNSKMIQCAREGGLEVGVWTPNGPARLSYWLSQEVDFLITDQPDLALKLRQEMGGLSNIGDT